MARRIRIEVQDQFGAWKHFTTCSDAPSSIKSALSQGLKSQLAQKSKKARAVDEKTGAIIDMAHG